MKHPRIGTVVVLKVRCLGNKAGTRGVCYETYTLGGPEAASFIFENGNYDGFPPEDQERFLIYIEDTDFEYHFTHVMQLSRDYTNGMFDFLKTPKRLVHK